MKWLTDLMVPPLKQAVEAEIRAQMDKFLPMIVRVVVQAVTESALKLSADGADKITDIIPGKLDDQIIDPLVRDIIGKLSQVFGR